MLANLAGVVALLADAARAPWLALLDRALTPPARAAVGPRAGEQRGPDSCTPDSCAQDS